MAFDADVIVLREIECKKGDICDVFNEVKVIVR